MWVKWMIKPTQSRTNVMNNWRVETKRWNVRENELSRKRIWSSSRRVSGEEDWVGWRVNADGWVSGNGNVWEINDQLRNCRETCFLKSPGDPVIRSGIVKRQIKVLFSQSVCREIILRSRWIDPLIIGKRWNVRGNELRIIEKNGFEVPVGEWVGRRTKDWVGMGGRVGMDGCREMFEKFMCNWEMTGKLAEITGWSGN